MKLRWSLVIDYQGCVIDYQALKGGHEVEMASGNRLPRGVIDYRSEERRGGKEC